MRHSPYPRGPKREATPRRMAAARRTINREREKLGMLADLFEFETPEERIARQTEGVEKWEQGMRRHRAESWHQARRELWELPEELRRQILHEWNFTSGLPGAPEYLLDLIRRRTKEKSVDE